LIYVNSRLSSSLRILKCAQEQFSSPPGYDAIPTPGIAGGTIFPLQRAGRSFRRSHGRWPVLTMFLVAAAIGVLSTVTRHGKAASLDSIEALRYEERPGATTRG
jgi:hypothetical protein